MPSIIDLEREFFKAAKDVNTYLKAKKIFLGRVNEISEKWIDDKFRLGLSGLKQG